ncbi:MAG: hypothetical protein V5A52_00940 [Halovenus sp.]
MIELTAQPAVQAAVVVGLVFVEALALYVGYGAIEERVAPPVLDAIANT